MDGTITKGMVLPNTEKPLKNTGFAFIIADLSIFSPANKAFFQEQMNKLTTAGMSGDAVHIECPTLADKIAFMNGIDLLSVPTEYREPKGIYLLEAWAAGVPVVQPAHGSFPELIEISKAGILVPPGDSGALASAWADLANDSERRLSMGKAGRKAVESHFSAHDMAKKTAKWYSLIL